MIATISQKLTSRRRTARAINSASYLRTEREVAEEGGLVMPTLGVARG
jgi:hypothetical protein